MSREKQIEEMACKNCIHYEVCMYVNAQAVEYVRAENCNLFKDNAGYRKIINCKDCIRCERHYPIKEKGKEAEEAWYCKFHTWYVNPDGFCSFAKMKGGAE